MRCLALAAALLAAGCPSDTTHQQPHPLSPVATGVRVRVFTEPAPVRLATAIGKYTFVATDNELARWDDRDQVTNPVPGSRFVALAPEPGAARLWILTDAGLGFYDTRTDVYSELVAPPTSLGIDYAQLARDPNPPSIQPAADGSSAVWLGTSHGLFYATAQGGWVATPITEEIHGLAHDGSGYLWIAAKGGLLARKPTGEVVKVTAAEGCAIDDPRLVVPIGNDEILVVGGDRLAIGKKLGWTTYRALPATHFDSAVGRGNAALVMANNRIYRISTDARTSRPLSRDTMRLVPLVGTPVDDWSIEPVDLAVPTNPTMLAVADDQLLIGTRDLGVARYRTTDKHPNGWLRRSQMFADAMTLTVACAHRDDCWVATGVHQAWHWIGDHFVPGGTDDTVLAVARDPSTSAIYALHRGATDTEIQIAQIQNQTWTPMPKLALTTPGDQPEISFARFTGENMLLVGLRYRDTMDRRPYGIALVDLSRGTVVYHHDDPYPISAVDAVPHAGAMWFATSEGIGRLFNHKLQLWTEADGLRSELARAVTIAADGRVVVATGAGTAVFDDRSQTWQYPPALQFGANDVVTTRNGQLWMATDRGVAAWDGKHLRRVDTHRGLAENAVLDLATDQYDRIWARGPSSLSLIAQ